MRVAHAEEPESRHRWAIDWAKADLPREVVEWADTVIIHHYLDRWLIPQWHRLQHLNIIWRTCGQSDPGLELSMKQLHERGVKIVRYSPKEAETFSALGVFAGQDELIRFGKYSDDYPAWIGDHGYIANVTQDMAGRGDFTGLHYWLETTAGLNAMPAGPKSEQLPGGVGALSYEAMLAYLKRAGAYVYTGTSPASYTLGLIEAMMVGVPIHVMPRERFHASALYEAPELVGSSYAVTALLADRALAESESARLRARASELFSVVRVGMQWDRFLGGLS